MAPDFVFSIPGRGVVSLLRTTSAVVVVVLRFVVSPQQSATRIRNGNLRSMLMLAPEIFTSSLPPLANQDSDRVTCVVANPYAYTL